MNPLVEYVQMSIARGELDNRMRELQQQILAGYCPRLAEWPGQHSADQ